MLPSLHIPSVTVGVTSTDAIFVDVFAGVDIPPIPYVNTALFNVAHGNFGPPSEVPSLPKVIPVNVCVAPSS